MVRLQAATRGLLVRRQLQGVRRQILEATLVAVDLGTQGLSPSASMVHVPQATKSNSTIATVGKALPSLSSARVHCLAPIHYATGHHEGASAGHCCDLFQLTIHVLPFSPDDVHGIQVVAHVQVYARRVSTLS